MIDVTTRKLANTDGKIDDFFLSLISIITIGIGNEVFSIGICFFTRQGGTGWGLGIVVNVVKKPTAGLGALPSKGGGYIVDTLLHCSLDQVRVAPGQDHARLGLEKRV
ncbi:hypothetical protein OIU77_005526 [Salix suchowensis]|uniref:Uncharacterized protein n=1 Tax=Salix suchowensis TaxID=1278906 RepID=A0ABQ9ARC2_9ROSI|nr:hypothetical protein OIU77_005526 [Salix suchowensis]